MLSRRFTTIFFCQIIFESVFTQNASNIMNLYKTLAPHDRENAEILHVAAKNSEYPFFTLQISARLSTKLNSTLCAENIRHTLQSAMENEKWALEMLDASSKFPVGLLYGSYYHFGNFDECINIEQRASVNSSRIQGQYCLIDVDLDGNQRAGRSANSFRTKNRNSFNNTIHWGICLPNSCKIHEVKAVAQEIVTWIEDRGKVTINLDEENCYFNNKPQPYASEEIFFLSSISSYIVLILISTIYHYMNFEKNSAKYSKIEEIVICFSVIRSVKKILNAESSDSSFRCISGLKSVSMVIILSAHCVLFGLGGPVLNSNYFQIASVKPQYAILVNSFLLVDTFLLISGFLVSYLLLKHLTKTNGKVNILNMYLNRFIRLTPSYLVIIGIYCFILKRLGNGPLWLSRVKIEEERCKISWWTNILYINNYINTDNICMFQSWYLSVDFQLFLLAPVLIYPIWRWPSLSNIISILYLLPTVLISFLVTYLGELDPTLMAFPPELRDLEKNAYFINAYIKTHMRASSYVIGVILGQVLFKMQSSNTKFSEMFLKIGWSFCGFCGLSSMLLIVVFYESSHRYNALEAALYSALHRLAWGLFISFIVIVCATDNSSGVNKILSWRVFTVLSRLTYSAYLVNGIVEIYNFYTARSPMFLSDVQFVNRFISHVSMTFAGGFVVCVLFESPFYGLQKIFFKKGDRRKTLMNSATC